MGLVKKLLISVSQLPNEDSVTGKRLPITRSVASSTEAVSGNWSQLPGITDHNED